MRRVKLLLRIALYALGAAAAIVIGLLVLRAVVHEVESLLAEFHANRATYIYVFLATAALSLLLGYILGRRVEEMRQQTMTDALTGLYNRFGLNLRLHDEYRRAERFHSPLTLMLIDIDRLKQINDEYGHGVGDQILRGAAHAIRNTLRETDCGARWGGDEFAIVAPNTTEPAAERLGERLLTEIPKWASLGGTAVTASVGLATAYPADASPTLEGLMSAADAALYQAKHGGRNQMRGA
jgi:diguanylate cyclase (GGDEF)-like protein